MSATEDAIRARIGALTPEPPKEVAKRGKAKKEEPVGQLQGQKGSAVQEEDGDEEVDE